MQKEASLAMSFYSDDLYSRTLENLAGTEFAESVLDLGENKVQNISLRFGGQGRIGLTCLMSQP